MNTKAPVKDAKVIDTKIAWLEKHGYVITNEDGQSYSVTPKGQQYLND